MAKMVGLLLSSFLKGSIWKEALKSLLYFFIVFLILLVPSFKLMSYFYGGLIEKQYGPLVDDVVIGAACTLLSLVVSYLFIMFMRDSYFYSLVRVEMGSNEGESNGLMNQVKSFVRIIFLLVATIIGILISFFLPLIGVVLMSFCFALEILSYVFDSEKVGLMGSFKFVSNNLLAVLILGGFCFFLSLIPGLGLVSYPASIRAGALYFKDQKELK